MTEESVAVSALQDLLPLRGGFYLEATGQSLCAWPEVPYRGDNRQYFGLPEDPDAYLHYVADGEPQNGSLIALWVRWRDSQWSGEVLSDLDFARSLSRQFTVFAHDNEIIYAEVAEIPGDLDRKDGLHGPETWLDVFEMHFGRMLGAHERIAQRPSSMSLLGYDVSHPQIGHHSAIMNPGLDKFAPNLPARLNENGLAPNIEVAREIMELANDTIGHRPYCVLGIWEVPP